MILNVGLGNIYSEILWSNGSTNDTLYIDQPGEYYASVLHESGISFQTDTFNVQPSPEIEFLFNVEDPTCSGYSDGSISLSYSSLEIDSIEWLNYGFIDSLIGLGSGAYFYQGTDENNCPFYGNISLEEPEQINVQWITEQGLDNDCPQSWFGSVQVSGGVDPYSYEWSLTNSSQPNSLFSTNENDFSCLEDGELTVTISDANECEFSFSEDFQILVDIQENDFKLPSLESNIGNNQLIVNNNAHLLGIKVFGMNGSRIYSDNSRKENYTLPFNTPGIYIIQLETTTISIFQKFILK